MWGQRSRGLLCANGIAVQRSAAKPTAPCFSFVDIRFAVLLYAEALSFVVLQREPQLFDCSVACLERSHAVTTEVVTGMLHGCLGALERRDGLAYLRMGLAPGASGRGLRGNWPLSDDRALRHGDG
jgi:hypothetical protein